jgi:hypothetical protein
MPTRAKRIAKFKSLLGEATINDVAVIIKWKGTKKVNQLFQKPQIAKPPMPTKCKIDKTQIKFLGLVTMSIERLATFFW